MEDTYCIYYFLESVYTINLRTECMEKRMASHKCSDIYFFVFTIFLNLFIEKIKGEDVRLNHGVMKIYGWTLFCNYYFLESIYRNNLRTRYTVK